METTRVPNIVASTAETYCCSISESRLRESKLKDDNSTATNAPRNVSSSNGYEDQIEANYFKSAQWYQTLSPRLNPTDNLQDTRRNQHPHLQCRQHNPHIHRPPSLLDDPSSIKPLTPYTAHLHPTSINCLAPYPLFNLSDPSTTVYLSTPNCLPIRLTNVLSPTPTPLSTYNFISPTTEAYLTPSSLLWSPTSPTHFLAGTDCLIALFDVSRNGQDPVTRMPTIPSKRHKMKGGGVGMRGIVSALSLQGSEGEEGMVAAGTWTRWVGLYDMGGMGGTVATWSIADAADQHAGIGGTGITQTAWSACGKYLFVIERKSRGVLVYDVRVTGKLVAWLEGREADTNQRLGIDVFQGENGSEIWAGGVDGVVRVWEGVGMTEGALEKSWDWRAHDDPISSTIIHHSGTVVATCSGQRSFPGDSEYTISENSDESHESVSSDDNLSSQPSASVSSENMISRVPDNTLKIWSL